MHVRVHRRIVCHTCSAEMSEYPGWIGWVRCIICGAKRRDEEQPRALGRDVA